MANFNYNTLILGGRLTADPELKTSQSGKKVTQISIATNRPGKDSGTDFINCVAWEKTAELICNYFKKGSSICVTGPVQVRKYKDKNGNDRTATECIIDKVNFVESKNEGDAEDSIPF